MKTTCAYFSAIVRPGSYLVKTKVHSYGFEHSGWAGDRRITDHTIGPRYPVFDIPNLIGVIRNADALVAGEVTVEVLDSFALLAWIISNTHGEFYPTWVGDYHVEGRRSNAVGTRKSRLDHWLVTESPGLDCGHWEEDRLPLGGL